MTGAATDIVCSIETSKKSYRKHFWPIFFDFGFVFVTRHRSWRRNFCCKYPKKTQISRQARKLLRSPFLSCSMIEKSLYLAWKIKHNNKKKSCSLILSISSTCCPFKSCETIPLKISIFIFALVLSCSLLRPPTPPRSTRWSRRRRTTTGSWWRSTSTISSLSHAPSGRTFSSRAFGQIKI